MQATVIVSENPKTSSKVQKERKPKAVKVVSVETPVIVEEVVNNNDKQKTEKMPALVSYYSKLKEKSSVSGSELKKLQSLYDKMFPDSVIRMKTELYSQLNKKSKCKTILFEDFRLGTLQKIPGSYPEMRHVLKYLSTKYTEELIGTNSLVSEIIMKYESPMNDVCVLTFTWTE